MVKSLEKEAFQRKWLSRAEYDPHNAPMAPARQVDETDEQPLLKILKDSGALDASQDVAKLSALVISLAEQVDSLGQETVQMRTYLQTLQREMLTLQKLIVDNGQVQESLNKTVGALERIATQKTPEILPVAFSFPESLVAKLESHPQDIQVSAPITIPTEQLAKSLVEGIEKALNPVLKSLADRPVSEVHHVDNSANLVAITKALDAVVERINSQSTIVSTDFTPIAKAIEDSAKLQQDSNASIVKSFKKVIESFEPLIQKVAEQGKAIEKALHKETPVEKKTITKMQQEYDGSWTISKEDA